MDATPASLLRQLHLPAANGAWDRFVELYAPVLFRWAETLGLQNADAADLVQDVFVALVRKLPDFEYDPTRSFRAWLKTVVLNQWRDCCRGPKPLATGIPFDQLPDPNQPEFFADDEYRRLVVHGALAQLERDYSPVLWQAFRRYALEEASPIEVARELGISPGTVYAIKSKVMLRLRQELSELLD